MANFKRKIASMAALSIFMTGSAAVAEVSPQQVWDDWKSYMAGFGYVVDANESTSGGKLTVSDIEMSMQIPDQDGSISMKMGQMTFSDNGDGTVAVSIPQIMPMVMSIDAPDGEDVDIAMEYASTGFAMNVSGSPDSMTYNYSAAELALLLKELVVEGAPVDFGKASMSMANVTGTAALSGSDLRTYNQRFSTGEVVYSVDFTDPKAGGRFVANGTFANMAFDGKGSFPAQMDPTNMAAMMAAGFGVDGGFSYESGATTFSVEEDGKTVQGTSSSEHGDLKVAMDGDRLQYSGSARNMQMQMMGGEIPFPIEMAMAESAFNLLIPVSKSDNDQDFALGITLGDFTISDMIWGIFDPMGQLPRDPATIAIDLSGKVELFFDLMDPEQMASVENSDEAPGELKALDLNALTLRAAGAELTGGGGFTFDNSDMMTFQGMPAPTGAIDLKLEGGNGLLDKLIAMGIMPEDQAMGMRMMMGLFAVPGDGDDTLTSKIEVTGDGKVLANGQRLK